MIKELRFCIACLCLSTGLWAQDTFSIVAVDTLTGEVGSAGASCLDEIQFPGSKGAIVISDLLPGRGAIHTQSYWHATNQANARKRMEEGLSPQEIINWLKSNDAQGGFSWVNRQYGIVDFDPQGHPRTAALTGSGCLNWKGHKTGVNYAIQGNILLGPQILDSMEARFLAATGPLSDRLMACLQGAKVPGADSRCLNNGTSSLSAFVRVARPGDAAGKYWLDLNVPSLPAGMEPIDSLQRLYDVWKMILSETAPAGTADAVRIFPNPASGWLTVEIPEPGGKVEWVDLSGRLVWAWTLGSRTNHLAPELQAGVYFIRVTTREGAIKTQKIVWKGV